MKLWQKAKNINNTLKEVDDFTIGNDNITDLYFIKQDILASFAHVLMLHEINIISKPELAKLKIEFYQLYQKALQNKIVIEDGVEDIHSQIEIMLTHSVGDLGKKIHSGRSRNDQILVDLKLFARDEIQEIVSLTHTLFKTLIKQSDKYKNVLMPGYTHTQVAMPSSFGLWFGAFAESLCDDMLTLQAAYKVTNQNPLGSGAGFGSSFPLNRQLTTKLLGFDDLNYNVIYAQMTRGKFEKIIVQALSNIMFTLNKMATDICSYSNENYDFIKLPQQFTTGSSIMPHKNNPDVLELVRSYSNKIAALTNEISMITHNLQTGYHRDLQLIKSSLIDSFVITKKCISIINLIAKQVQINKNIIKETKYKYLLTVEEVNKLVLNGMPFRDAYKIIGEQVENNSFTSNTNIKHTHLGSIGNLGNTHISNKMNLILKQFNFKKANQAIILLLKIMN